MAKKLSGRALADRLIPNRLHKTKFDADCHLNIRYPFEDNDQITLSFNEIVEMLEQAHHLAHHDLLHHQLSSFHHQPSSLLNHHASAKQQHGSTELANWKVRMAKLINKAS